LKIFARLWLEEQDQLPWDHKFGIWKPQFGKSESNFTMQRLLAVFHVVHQDHQWWVALECMQEDVDCSLPKEYRQGEKRFLHFKKKIIVKWQRLLISKHPAVVTNV
jgi:hypothetical protein